MYSFFFGNKNKNETASVASIVTFNTADLFFKILSYTTSIADVLVLSSINKGFYHKIKKTSSMFWNDVSKRYFLDMQAYNYDQFRLASIKELTFSEEEIFIKHHLPDSTVKRLFLLIKYGDVRGVKNLIRDLKKSDKDFSNQDFLNLLDGEYRDSHGLIH